MNIFWDIFFFCINTDKLDREMHLSSTHIFVREGIKLMEDYRIGNRKGPFFLQLSFSMPHDPLVVDEIYEQQDSCKDMPNFRRKKYKLFSKK